MNTTTYADSTEHAAIHITWDDVSWILGRTHEGTPDDDAQIIAYLTADGAPSWVADAEGWTDEFGWGLIGPELRYTVREPGSSYWSRTATLDEAERDLAAARDAGLDRAIIITD